MKAIFKIFRECKHSRRYQTDDEDFPIRDIYVKREFANNNEEIELEVKEG